MLADYVLSIDDKFSFYRKLLHGFPAIAMSTVIDLVLSVGLREAKSLYKWAITVIK